MPNPGITTTPDLATATTNLETALREFQTAMKESPLPRVQTSLFAALRAWRTEQARTQKVPPYVIGNDELLRAIEKANPGSRDELAAVRGMSPAKMTAYGDQILGVLGQANQASQANPASQTGPVVVVAA